MEPASKSKEYLKTTVSEREYSFEIRRDLFNFDYLNLDKFERNRKIKQCFYVRREFKNKEK